MSTYLVRIQNTKELVGLFWSENMNQLYDTIDEACDPAICEIKKLTFGGVFWGSQVPVTLPLNEEEDYDDTKSKLKNYCLSDILLDDITDSKGWKSMDKYIEKYDLSLWA